MCVYACVCMYVRMNVCVCACIHQPGLGLALGCCGVFPRGSTARYGVGHQTSVRRHALVEKLSQRVSEPNIVRSVRKVLKDPLLLFRPGLAQLGRRHVRNSQGCMSAGEHQLCEESRLVVLHHASMVG